MRGETQTGLATKATRLTAVVKIDFWHRPSSAVIAMAYRTTILAVSIDPIPAVWTTSQPEEWNMDIEEAFREIPSRLRAMSKRGVKPSIRAAGKDWVCRMEDKQTKFNLIAKDGELIMVTAESTKAEPHLERIQAPGLAQQEIIDRIEKAIAEVYGA